MSYNGSGTFAINSSGQPVVAGTVISSTVFNSLTADLGTGLSTAITKDGQTTTTARILFAAGISSTLVTDATSISTGSLLTLGGLGVTKAAWIGGLMNVAGAATFQSTIGITGALTATTINASGLVAMAGAATVGTTLAVSGTATMAAINASGTVAMAGAATVGTTLGVTGATTLSSTLDVTGEVQQGGSVSHLLSVSTLAYELRGNATGAETVYGNSTGTGKMSVGYLQGNDKGYCIAGAPALVLGASNVGSVEISSTGLSVTGTLGVTGEITGAAFKTTASGPTSIANATTVTILTLASASSYIVTVTSGNFATYVCSGFAALAEGGTTAYLTKFEESNAGFVLSVSGTGLRLTNNLGALVSYKVTITRIHS